MLERFRASTGERVRKIAPWTIAGGAILTAVNVPLGVSLILLGTGGYAVDAMIKPSQPQSKPKAA